MIVFTDDDIEHVKGKSNPRTTHAVLNKCKCCAFDDANLNLGKRKVILKVETGSISFVLYVHV